MMQSPTATAAPPQLGDRGNSNIAETPITSVTTEELRAVRAAFLIALYLAAA